MMKNQATKTLNFDSTWNIYVDALILRLFMTGKDVSFKLYQWEFTYFSAERVHVRITLHSPPPPNIPSPSAIPLAHSSRNQQEIDPESTNTSSSSSNDSSASSVNLGHATYRLNGLFGPNPSPFNFPELQYPMMVTLPPGHVPSMQFPTSYSSGNFSFFQPPSNDQPPQPSVPPTSTNNNPGPFNSKSLIKNPINSSV
jgi:hypothetical protein